MPELPEVETIVRCLEPRLLGRTVISADVLWHKTVQGDSKLLKTALPRAQVTAVTRRAKLALVHLNTPDGAGLILAFHLKMSGALLLKPHNATPAKHVRLVLHFSQGEDLHFDDTRKFGYCRIQRPQDLPSWPFYAALGPEPLLLPADDFITRFSRRSAIKALLLNQTIIAGVGNIYADESLHAAGINPATPGHTLSPQALTRLHHSLQKILSHAIEGCGTSIRDYLNAEGEPGAFQNELRVYGRANQPCLRCNTPLRATKIAGRTTVYCPGCQKNT